jgi:uncharacterized OsmC-like protein
MTTIRLTENQNEIYNEAGLQLVGTTAPDGNGLSPRELLEASLGLCISISLQKVLERDSISYDKSALSIKVTASKAPDVTNRFTHFHVTVAFPPSFDSAFKNKLLTVIERACTISNTLKNTPVIETVEA